MIPESEAEAFFYYFLKDKQYDEQDGKYFVPCTNIALWPPVFVLLGTKWLEISAQDYIIDVSLAQDKSACKVGWEINRDNFWVFGSGLYEGYYVTHNPELPSVGFALLKDTWKREIPEGGKPSDPL